MKNNKIFKGLALLALMAMLSMVFIGCPGNGKSLDVSKLEPGPGTLDHFIEVPFPLLDKWLETKASATEVNYIKIIEIPEEALKGTNSESGKLGKTIKASGKKVFLSGLKLKDNKELKKIPDFCFDQVTNIIGINLPASLSTIGQFAFTTCYALTSISVADGNTSYSSENGVLFDKDKTTLKCYPAGKTDTSYSVPSSVTTIGPHAFLLCKALTSIDLSGCTKLSTIRLKAFFSCTEATVKLPNAGMKIEESAFESCKEVQIPAGNAYNLKKKVEDSGYTGTITEY